MLPHKRLVEQPSYSAKQTFPWIPQQLSCKAGVSNSFRLVHWAGPGPQTNPVCLQSACRACPVWVSHVVWALNQPCMSHVAHTGPSPTCSSYLGWSLHVMPTLDQPCTSNVVAGAGLWASSGLAPHVHPRPAHMHAQGWLWPPRMHASGVLQMCKTLLCLQHMVMGLVCAARGMQSQPETHRSTVGLKIWLQPASCIFDMGDIGERNACCLGGWSWYAFFRLTDSYTVTKRCCCLCVFGLDQRLERSRNA